MTLAMLAYAFLVVTAVTEHARHPAPPGVIQLTCNEIQHLFAALAYQPASHRWHRCTGRGGDAGTKPTRVPATTDGKQPTHEGHDLRLEY